MSLLSISDWFYPFPSKKRIDHFQKNPNNGNWLIWLLLILALLSFFFIGPTKI